MYRLGSSDGEMAPIAWERMIRPFPSGIGCENGGPKFGSWMCMRESWPGAEYSGCPGSRSSIATPVFAPWEMERSRFARILANVDLPDDFGPQSMMDGVFLAVLSDIRAIASFHSGGEMRGWRNPLDGPS